MVTTLHIVWVHHLKRLWPLVSRNFMEQVSLTVLNVRMVPFGAPTTYDNQLQVGGNSNVSQNKFNVR